MKKVNEKILMYIDAAIVLHIILIELKDDVCIERDYDEDVTVNDDPNSVEKNPAEQRLFECIQVGAPRGGEKIKSKIISVKWKLLILLLQFLIMHMA